MQRSFVFGETKACVHFETVLSKRGETGNLVFCAGTFKTWAKHPLAASPKKNPLGKGGATMRGGGAW